ncbi:MAG TPA: hypothetical protein VGX97_04875 [bacterium]|nr:hypothetical protein [bacterium]
MSGDDAEADPHAGRRERRLRQEREGMQVHGRSVRRLAELSARPGHLPSAAVPAAVKRRRSKRRRRR